MSTDLLELASALRKAREEGQDITLETLFPDMSEQERQNLKAMLGGLLNDMGFEGTTKDDEHKTH